MEKICITCRADVRGAPELKDEQGNFYCPACADAANRAADDAETVDAFVNPAPAAMPDVLQGLAHASAAHEYVPGITDAARDVLAKIKDDAGPFYHIAAEFVLPGVAYNGPVYISPTAIYFLKGLPKVGHNGAAIAAAAAGGAAFGLVGAVAAGLATGALAGSVQDKQRATPYTCLIKDLPPQIRASFDPKNNSHNVPSVILLRQSASSVTLESDFLIIVTGGQVYQVPLGDIRQVVRIMKNMGWRFGVPASPDAAAHDARLIKMRAPVRRTSPAIYVLVAIFGLLIVVMIILFIMASLR